MARPNAEAFLAQQGMTECYQHLDTWLKRLTDEENTANVKAFRVIFDAEWENHKTWTASYPHSHDAARYIYIQHLDSIHRMLKAIDKHREDIPARMRDTLFEFQVEFEYAFAQPYTLHHERDKKHGSLIRHN